MSSQAEGPQESSPALTLWSGPLVQATPSAWCSHGEGARLQPAVLLEGQAGLVCQIGASTFGLWHEDLGFSGRCGLVLFLSGVLSFEGLTLG